MRCKSLGMLWVFIVLYQPLITNYNYATSTIVTFNFHVLDKNASVLYQWGIYHQGIYYNIVLDLRFTSTWNMHMGNNQD